MKQEVRMPQSIGVGFKKYAVIIIKQALTLAAGFLSSGIPVTGGAYPFGAAFTAAVPESCLVTAFLGSALGYLLPMSSASVRYIACSAAAAVIKFAVFRISRSGSIPGWSFTAAGVLLFLTGAVMSGASFSGIALTLAESAVGGGAAFFLCDVFSVDLTKGPKDIRETASLAAAAALVLTGLFPLASGSAPIGGAAGAVLCIAAGAFGGTVPSVITGTVCGISGFLALGDPFIPLIFTVSGFASGLAGKLGKLAASSAFILAAVSSAALLGFGGGSAELLTSVLIGSVISAVIPLRIFSRTSVFFRPASIKSDPYAGIKRSLKTRLGFASDALLDIKNTVAEVSEKLSVSDRPDFSAVLVGTKRDACLGCGFLEQCWEREREETERTVKVLAGCLHSRRPIGLAELSENFALRCPRKERVENAVLKYNAKYTDRADRDSRSREVRDALADQFTGFSEMLRDAALDMEQDEKYDEKSANDFKNALSAMGSTCESCTCRTDKYGRIHLEALFTSRIKHPIGRSRIRAAASGICGREFDIPEAVRSEKGTLITLSEKRVFDPEHGICRIKCSGSKVSGDSADFFLDGKGKAYAVISDGMGTGSRAAVDSAMVTGLFKKLICSGFGFACALRLINTSMMYRSSEESTATLDVAVFDLYTGDVSIFKAGAAPTVVKRDGRTAKADCKSLPLGILREVSFDKAILKMKAGDILVMTSDGASYDGVDDIICLLGEYDGQGADAISEKIAHSAAARRNDGHSDDITVLTVIMEKAL